MISWMNASFGYKFRVDLEKNGDRVRVKVDSFHNWELASSIEGLNLQVVRISCADAFEDRAVEPLYSKNFYDLSRYGRSQAFTESLEEKQAACDKVIARYLASDRDTRTELQPSAALIRRLKQRKGFTNATRAHSFAWHEISACQKCLAKSVKSRAVCRHTKLTKHGKIIIVESNRLQQLWR